MSGPFRLGISFLASVLAIISCGSKVATLAGSRALESDPLIVAPEGRRWSMQSRKIMLHELPQSVKSLCVYLERGDATGISVLYSKERRNVLLRHHFQDCDGFPIYIFEFGAGTALDAIAGCEISGCLPDEVEVDLFPYFPTGAVERAAMQIQPLDRGVYFVRSFGRPAVAGMGVSGEVFYDETGNPVAAQCLIFQKSPKDVWLRQFADCLDNVERL